MGKRKNKNNRSTSSISKQIKKTSNDRLNQERNLSDTTSSTPNLPDSTLSSVNALSMNSQSSVSNQPPPQIIPDVGAKQNAIPAFKFTINHSQVSKYSSPKELKSEILKNKKVNFEKIKFFDIKINLIIIATDDLKTYQTLNTEWPADAFSNGIRIRSPETNTSLNIVIIGVHKDIDVSEPSIKSELEQYGITKVTRPNKRDGQPSSILKAKAKSKEFFEHLMLNKIVISLASPACQT